MRLLWEKVLSKPTLPSLEGDIKTDVLIIRGGMAGVLCVYMLNQAGV